MRRVLRRPGWRAPVIFNDAGIGKDRAGVGSLRDLETWLRQQLDDHLVEPNSGLGAAICMRKHWAKLTLFLPVPGAPLDNNVCERALKKKAILHRKNALFY